MLTEALGKVYKRWNVLREISDGFADVNHTAQLIFIKLHMKHVYVLNVCVYVFIYVCMYVPMCICTHIGIFFLFKHAPLQCSNTTCCQYTC
jgi:hypothetical protein